MLAADIKMYFYCKIKLTFHYPFKHSLVLNNYCAIKIIYGYFQDQVSFDIVIFLQQVEAASVEKAPSRPTVPLKADSHVTCQAHAVPLSCRAAKGLECVFPI